jgi:hypothetical protein
MSERIVSVTVTLSCDRMGCDTPPRTTTAPDRTTARRSARSRGWTVSRRYGIDGYTLCPKCAKREAALVKGGILSGDGYVLDSARYDEHLDAEARA